MISYDYKIDIPNSILLGDKITDIQAGQRAGILTNILYDRNGFVNFEIESVKNFFRVINFQDVKQYFIYHV